MKALFLAALLGGSLSVAGAASAADRIVAQLESPIAAQKLVSGGAIWNCEGSTCAATGQTSRSTSLRACQALAKEVGRLSSFGSEKTTFEAEQLARCNTAAASQATATETAAAN